MDRCVARSTEEGVLLLIGIAGLQTSPAEPDEKTSNSPSRRVSGNNCAYQNIF